MGAGQCHQGTLSSEIDIFNIKTGAKQLDNNTYYSQELLEEALQLSQQVAEQVGGFNSDVIQTLNIYIHEAKQKLAIKS